ncbi:MAG: hypothetical protein N4A35_02805 [Flavobacteriales bacterium]|jgi:hypothetical protein|nr:hypothetical protein [Flavobacteriales bacterium]
MKKIIVILGIAVIGFNGIAQEKTSEVITLSQEKYVPLTEERFNQIEDIANAMEDLIPIRIKDVPREELIKFYIQSYSDAIVSSWMDFAYKKMTKFDLIKVNSKQDKTFKELMHAEQNRANMFLFMSAMTDQQIETVGY